MNDELVLQEIMLPVINCHDDGKALFLIGQNVMIVEAQRFTQECQQVPFCNHTTPMPLSEASVSIWNRRDKLGRANTGAELRANLRAMNAES
jgi:hypothetical protein